MSIKFPDQLNIIIRTSIPGFQEIEYKPSMTIKDTNEKDVMFNPLIKLNESVVSKIPQEYKIKEFFNKGLFQSLLNYTGGTPAKDLIHATRYGYVDNNINVTLNSIFPVGSVIYIDKKPYVIADHQWTTGDWKIKGTESQLRNFPNSVIVGNNYSGPPVIIPEIQKKISVPSTRPIATGPSIIQSATSAAERAAETVTSAAQSLASPAKRAQTAKASTQAAQTAAQTAANTARSAQERATNVAQEAAKTAQEAVRAAQERATNVAQEAVRSAQETATNVAQEAAETATNTVRVAQEAVRSAQETATNAAQEAAETAKETATIVAQEARERAQTAAENAKTATQKVLALTNASPEETWEEHKAEEPWEEHKAEEPWEEHKAEEPWEEHKAEEPWEEHKAEEHKAEEPWEEPSEPNQPKKKECPSEGINPVKCNNKKDYFKQALIFHPDKNKDCQVEATDKFQRLQNLCESGNPQDKPQSAPKEQSQRKAHAEREPESVPKPDSAPKPQTKSWFNFNPFKRGGSTSKNTKNKNNKTKKIVYTPKPAYVVVIDMELHPGTSLTPKELYESKCNSRYNAIRKAYSEFTGTPYVIPPVYTHKTSQTKKTVGGKKNKITRKRH